MRSKKKYLVSSLRFFQLFLILCLIVSTTACSEYWWTRGQPPSIETLVERSHERFNETLAKRGSFRPSLAKISSDLEKSLGTTYHAVQPQASAHNIDLVQELEHGRNLLLDLEPELSIGSRAAYGELSGQMRTFLARVAEGKSLSPEIFGLFNARICFFLANELEVPGPLQPKV